ncbi:MAG: LPS export ABC transporter permease LptF [Pseudomonadota bacterium]|nr:LPS export ABC transporter permease LptF [Pseudomonadota bacterium]
MNRLGLYLFRQLSIAFVFASVAVAFVILFTQSFRVLSLVIENSSTALVFFQLMGLSIPTFLPLVLPLGLGVAIVFVYHKLAIDSELVVMRAAGVSPMRQAKPALALTGLVLIICYALTLWITPAANRNLVELQYQVRDSYAVFLSRPGNFNDITNGLTFYAQRRGANGALQGILIHDVRHAEVPITIMADTGQIVNNTDQPQIVIFNGRRQEMNVNTGKLSELAFDQYVLDLNALRNTTNHRPADPREQSVGQLLHPTEEMLHGRATHEHIIAELSTRLSSPLLALSYALIGLAAILAGEFNRRGMGRRILIAGAAIIFVQALFMSLNNTVAHDLWMAFVLPLGTLVPAAISFILLNGDPWRRRALRQRNARPAHP